MGKKKIKLVAEIALYGTHEIGHGYIGQTADGRMVGDGTPKGNRSATEAVWLACADLRVLLAKELAKGEHWVRIYAPGGEHMALASIGRPGYYGDLKWSPAIKHVISAEAVKGAAQ